MKPDIAAPGTYIRSCNYKWETHQDFVDMSGTSMSAPHVAGAAALLMDAGLTSSLEARVMLMVTVLLILSYGPMYHPPSRLTARLTKIRKIDSRF